MWKCTQCSEMIEDQFDSCWRCAGQAQPTKSLPRQERPTLQCLRCRKDMEFYGNKRFHEGGHLASALGDMLVNRESFDVYVCPQCGHVEFFMELPQEEGEDAGLV